MLTIATVAIGTKLALYSGLGVGLFFGLILGLMIGANNVARVKAQEQKLRHAAEDELTSLRNRVFTQNAQSASQVLNKSAQSINPTTPPSAPKA